MNYNHVENSHALEFYVFPEKENVWKNFYHIEAPVGPSRVHHKFLDGGTF